VALQVVHTGAQGDGVIGEQGVFRNLHSIGVRLDRAGTGEETMPDRTRIRTFPGTGVAGTFHLPSVRPLMRNGGWFY
jgi:hypothetical protein